MANPLFYERVVPLDSRAHRALRLAPLDRPYAFAAHSNMVPALTDEFLAAAPFLPIAFLPGADKPAAVFVTGLKPGRNLFVGPDGAWRAGYLPAYLRRYPFIMGNVPDSQPILCIDDGFAGFGEDRGEPLFSDAGTPEPALAQALALAENYRTAAERSDAFCAALNELGLFRPVTLDAKQPDGETTVVHGLMVVDEAALDALGEADIARLHRERFLKPIYAHLASLGALGRLAELARDSAPARADA